MAAGRRQVSWVRRKGQFITAVNQTISAFAPIPRVSVPTGQCLWTQWVMLEKRIFYNGHEFAWPLPQREASYWTVNNLPFFSLEGGTVLVSQGCWLYSYPWKEYRAKAVSASPHKMCGNIRDLRGIVSQHLSSIIRGRTIISGHIPSCFHSVSIEH